MGFIKKNGARVSFRGHIKNFMQAECIGEACPSFGGKECSDSERQLITVGRPSIDGDFTESPPLDEATYAVYGQNCLAEAAPELAAQRFEIYRPEGVSLMMVFALTEGLGKVPVQIVCGNSVYTVGT